MKILETIKQQKKKEVEERKSLYPIKLLEKSIYFETQCVSLKSYISNEKYSGIIAEFKRKSPSKGNINLYADAEKVTLGYMQAGASALSVLTDETFFGAKKQDLLMARKLNYCPILRKDFIIDEYQIVESKAMGADTILLIAKMLSPTIINQFTDFAHLLGMEVLLETHTETEILENINTTADLVGINNRNLNTFEVDIENSIRLAEMLPKTIVKIAESGIESAGVIKELKNNGFSGFLIGEYFMRDSDPATKCAELIKELKE
ncbi:indole-3-glycerol phosphate synthase TrpC [Flavobacterium cerinum]|uniref:indole-3-glycerol-phosphate synthase n=1 Tax=Flavobacterium cerinum TaxID=2502784 RepID=A0A3S3QLI0_9FLAO|nr:indole-3-glycerol phosphate synthase TrpC [Flavobacterium cerinum]RWW91895.1 indole-3-glycerol phosphate synthase TrpC [Flavobacterium cerinum]